ncbi:MAG: hypothetical protein IH964_13120 [Candidatus Dadabacteria bacterium]|nr:hypothetical protein [Candidatus Dadabacteria bacterium]
MKIPWKERIKASLENDKRKRKEQQKILFNRIYNKPKDYEFPKVSDIDLNRFFFFPKFGEDFFMSLPSIAIYPVLCLLSDFEENNWFQISQKNIAIMAGISVNTVAKGIKDLEERLLNKEPFLEKQKQKQGTRNYYVYRVNYNRKDDIENYKGEYFTFHKCIVESGVWADLKPRAKALYLSMRMSARFEVELYTEVEDLDLDFESSEIEEFYSGSEYRNRLWDVSNTSLAELCRKVEIKPINLRPIIQQLENHRLIERVDEYCSLIKVYLKPKIKT